MEKIDHVELRHLNPLVTACQKIPRSFRQQASVRENYLPFMIANRIYTKLDQWAVPVQWASSHNNLGMGRGKGGRPQNQHPYQRQVDA